MRSSSRTILSVAVLAAALWVIRGHAQDQTQAQPQSQPQPQQTGDQPQQPVFRGGINFVRVDVIVSDKTGNPIGDLRATDFDVTEDGKPQKIETFKLVKLDGGAMPTPDGPLSTDSLPRSSWRSSSTPAPVAAEV